MCRSVLGPLKCFGGYCIRATVNKYDEKGAIKSVYHGYSEDIDAIIEQTELVCDRRRSESDYCSNASIMYLKQIPNCSGLITESDKNGDNKLMGSM